MVIYQPVSKLPVPIRAYRFVKRWSYRREKNAILLISIFTHGKNIALPCTSPNLFALVNLNEAATLCQPRELAFLTSS
jgi:hypothetical protein